MCWFLRLRVLPATKRQVPIEDVRAIGNSRSLDCTLADSEYFLTQGGCSCDLVEPQGRSIKPIDAIIDLIRHPAVKAVEVLWSFHSDEVLPCQAGRAERLTIVEFEARNVMTDLLPGVWYRVLDPNKWHTTK